MREAVVVADGSAVLVGELVAVCVEVTVAVFVNVGGVPSRVNEPEAFHCVPMKIRAS